MKLRSVARAVALMLVVASASGRAAPAVRTTVVQHGGFVLIGNTLAHDCAAGTPAPVVGTVGSCGLNTADSAPDVPWRADSPAPGMAEASTAITPAQARSTAVLSLPAGATVTHSFLYWAATLPQGSSAADGDAVLDRPGASPFSATVSSTASWVTGSSYQAVADVTDLVRGNGPGAYRVSGVSTQAPANLNSSTYFAGWALVVLYERAADPLVALTVADGLDFVTTTSPSAFTLSGFVVPPAFGAASLGVVAFEGDNLASGDQLMVNGAALSNAQNPAADAFNGTRSTLGTATTVAGDLPQLTGTAQSLSGVDLDVFDVTARLASGTTSVAVQAFTSSDTFFVGAWVSAIPTITPVLTVGRRAPRT